MKQTGVIRARKRFSYPHWARPQLVPAGSTRVISPWTDRFRRSLALLTAVVFVGIAAPAAAHEAEPDPVFNVGEASPGGATYGNPRFVIADGYIDLDLTWSPPPQDEGYVSFYHRELDRFGIPLRQDPGYHLGDYNCPYFDCSGTQQPVHLRYRISTGSEYNELFACCSSPGRPLFVAKDVACIQETPTERVSVTPNGDEQGRNHGSGVISDDGRQVVFWTDADNIAPRDDCCSLDVFVRDKTAGTTKLVSAAVSGERGNGHSGPGAISHDGRYIAFESEASDLVDNDTNGVADVFVRDMEKGITTRVSVGLGAAQANGASREPDISADGRMIVFQSHASNLDPSDNGPSGWTRSRQVFVHDRTMGTTRLLSRTITGSIGNAHSSQPAISSDGRVAAFTSSASNLVAGDTNRQNDVFVRDLTTGIIERVSVGVGGVQGNWYSERPSLSGDGQIVAFESGASNLVVGDGNRNDDIFVRDRGAAATRRVSIPSMGVEGVGSSRFASVSANGRYVAFHSSDSNFVGGDTNWYTDVYVHDLVAGATSRYSTGTQGQEPNERSQYASINSDGSLVAFQSGAWNLVCDDENASVDVFVVPNETLKAPNPADEAFSYVALGDSYSSGEGVQPYEDSTDLATNQCHRSELAYPGQVMVGDNPISVKLRSQAEDAASWSFVACSGARTFNVKPAAEGGEGQWDEPAQLDSGLVDAETDLVSITIGGNDAGYGAVIDKCSFDECTDAQFNGMPFPEWVEANVRGVYQDILATSASIVQHAPNATVAFLGYPKVMPDGNIERLTCPRLAPYSHAEKDFINDMTLVLNGVLETASTEGGARFVSVTEAFEGHEVCGDGGEWINGPYFANSAEESWVEDRSFHPNEAGQSGYAAVLNEWLRGGATSTAAATREAEVAASDSLLADSEPPLGSIGSLRLRVAEKSAAHCPGHFPGSVILQADGFAPEAEVAISLYSPGQDQQVLSPLSVGSDGSVSATLPLSGLVGGVHGVELLGADADAGERLVVGSFESAAPCPEGT